MRVWASILALIAVPALAQIPLTTADNWQSIVQTAAPSTTLIFAAGDYQATNDHIAVTNAGAILIGAGPTSTYFHAAEGCRVFSISATNVVLSGMNISGGSTNSFAGGVLGHGQTLITNCWVVSNTAWGGSGGGVYKANVANSLIAWNAAHGQTESGMGGGGIGMPAGSWVKASVVSNNLSAYVRGGGISARVNAANVWAYDCIIVTNRATNASYGIGGGAHAVNLSNCVVAGNFAAALGGGAVGGFITGSVLSNNVSGGSGGGAQGAILLDVVVANNTAGTSGGGGYNLRGTNMVIRDNVAGTAGGGMYAGLAESSTIERNVANGLGGGGAAWATLLYSLIVSNRAPNAMFGSGGGGINDCTVDSCAFVDNYAILSGDDSFNSTVRNCTILNTNAAVPVVQHSSYPSAVIANTLVVHASQTNVVDQYGAAWTNVSANYFTNSATGLFLPDDPPYRLPPDSPLIDAGNDTYATTPVDLYGRTRTQGQVDIGAVEYTPEIDVVSGAVGRKKLLMLLLR